MPLVSRTRATLRSAEFGFLGVTVYTRVQTPRFCGAPRSAGVLVFATALTRGLRTSWLIVGIRGTGSSVEEGATPASPGAARSASERRMASILFADIVGFTPLAESRDPEEVRELLGRYFETAQEIVQRYGGVLEKFIGDAVVALWGAPVAQEDDAERAVRTALDLVSAVRALGAEAGVDLALRAGVSTGSVAVTLGAEGQGMVAGDVVNTTARIQAAAEPGTVLVDEATRRATEAAIAHEA